MFTGSMFDYVSHWVCLIAGCIVILGAAVAVAGTMVKAMLNYWKRSQTSEKNAPAEFSMTGIYRDQRSLARPVVDGDIADDGPF